MTTWELVSNDWISLKNKILCRPSHLNKIALGDLTKKSSVRSNEATNEFFHVVLLIMLHKEIQP